MTTEDECQQSKLPAFLRVASMPRMGSRGVGLTVLASAALVGTLLGLLYATKHVPGADVAFQLFRE